MPIRRSLKHKSFRCYHSELDVLAQRTSYRFQMQGIFITKFFVLHNSQRSVTQSGSPSQLLKSQNKFSGPQKFSLRYQKFHKKGVEINIQIGNVSKTIFFSTREYFKISVFETSGVDYLKLVNSRYLDFNYLE